MRKSSVECLCLIEKLDNLMETLKGGFLGDPTSFHRHKHGHDAESAATDGARFLTVGVFAEVRFIIDFVDVVPI